MKTCAQFPETRWSLVLAASERDPGDPAARQALDELCERYWFPLYAFARRYGLPKAEAEDATQGFFAMLLARELLGKAESARGRLRSFLLGSFKNFISTERRRDHSEKRGGRESALSFDHPEAEDWLAAAAVESRAPEEQFDREWAHATVALAYSALEAECAQRGKATLFGQLRDFLTWDEAASEVTEAARALGLTVGAVRVAIHRLRLAFRRHLEAQIAQTVASPDDARAELEHLLRILRG